MSSKDDNAANSASDVSPKKKLRSSDEMVFSAIIHAFDVELAGRATCSDVPAIGTAAVRYKVYEADGGKKRYCTVEIIDKKRWNMYIPKEYVANGIADHATEFDEDTWDDFWSKPTQKELLENHFKMPAPKEGNVKLRSSYVKACAWKEFHTFRERMEELAEKEEAVYIFTSDNLLFDGGVVNHNYHVWLSEKPLPYCTRGDQGYSPIYDSHQLALGMLMDRCPDAKFWNVMDQLKKALPDHTFMECPVEHDHLPENDALTICYDMINLFNIQKHVQ